MQAPKKQATSKKVAKVSHEGSGIYDCIRLVLYEGRLRDFVVKFVSLTTAEMIAEIFSPQKQQTDAH